MRNGQAHTVCADIGLGVRQHEDVGFGLFELDAAPFGLTEVNDIIHQLVLVVVLGRKSPQDGWCGGGDVVPALELRSCFLRSSRALLSSGSGGRDWFKGHGTVSRPHQEKVVNESAAGCFRVVHGESTLSLSLLSRLTVLW